jgi:hypothetical protein
LFKAEDGNTINWKFEGTAGNDSIEDGLLSFDVRSLVTDGGRVDGEFESNEWTCDLGVCPNASFGSAEVLNMYVRNMMVYLGGPMRK